MIKLMVPDSSTVEQVLVEWGRAQDPVAHWTFDPAHRFSHKAFAVGGHRYHTTRILFAALRGPVGTTVTGRPASLVRRCDKPGCANPFHYSARLTPYVSRRVERHAPGNRIPAILGAPAADKKL